MMPMAQPKVLALILVSAILPLISGISSEISSEIFLALLPAEEEHGLQKARILDMTLN